MNKPIWKHSQLLWVRGERESKAWLYLQYKWDKSGLTCISLLPSKLQIIDTRNFFFSINNHTLILPNQFWSIRRTIYWKKINKVNDDFQLSRVFSGLYLLRVIMFSFIWKHENMWQLEIIVDFIIFFSVNSCTSCSEIDKIESKYRRPFIKKVRALLVNNFDGSREASRARFFPFTIHYRVL